MNYNVSTISHLSNKTYVIVAVVRKCKKYSVLLSIDG